VFADDDVPAALEEGWVSHPHDVTEGQAGAETPPTGRGRKAQPEGQAGAE
jgi:hypothetical protein